VAPPSSNKGNRSKTVSGKSRTGKRIRAETSASLEPELFPEADLQGGGLPKRLTQRRVRDFSASEEEDLPFEEPAPVQSDARVPKNLVKFIVALFLAPLVWILTRTFFQSFAISLHHGLLATQSFGCFAAGMILFVILFLLVPREALMLPYVFGHELTHALWVKLFGGRVADHFHVSLEGGHVLSDRVNTWIALAPYFFPIYSLLVVTLYGAGSLVSDLGAYRWILFLLLGFTLAFHRVFTCLLIVKGQPDLHYGGTFFSLVVIYLINLLIITGLLLATGKEITPRSFGEDFVTNTIGFIEFIRALAGWIGDWIANFRAGFGNH
jgi:hypothetical protein